MNQDSKFSDEFINAFVDDQLTPEEKSQVYTHLSGNETLNRQICQLRKVRDLVQLAYKEPPAPVKHAPSFVTRRKYSLGLVAGLTLLIGGVFGWFLHQTSVSHSTTMALATAMDPQTTPAKVLFHVSDGQAAHLKSVLDDVEDLIKYYQQSNQKARVEVITNGEGLSLLLADVSPYRERVQQMQRDYRDLTFIACQNTIERYQNEQGVMAKLLPGVIVIDSGVAQMMRRQLQGWAYLQV